MTGVKGTDQAKGARRLSVLQALIVFAVAGLVAALALPALASQAKTSVLSQNQAALAQQVRAQIALSSDGMVSDALHKGLRSGALGRFVDPISGSAAIVRSASLPARGAEAPPAIWITDDPRYAYAVFSPSDETRAQLAGSLLVVFVNEGSGTTIDVYYVDASGQRSASVETLAATL